MNEQTKGTELRYVKNGLQAVANQFDMEEERIKITINTKISQF